MIAGTRAVTLTAGVVVSYATIDLAWAAESAGVTLALDDDTGALVIRCAYDLAPRAELALRQHEDDLAVLLRVPLATDGRPVSVPPINTKARLRSRRLASGRP
jgi:hypothetical protein